MQKTLQGLFDMFYPLNMAEQRRWAAILSLSEDAYLSALEEEASKWGLRQKRVEGAVAWSDKDEHELLLLFRVEDPSLLDAIRQVYDTIAAHDAPLAYAFVRQLPDGKDTWDIFHMSKLTYLAHCNRVSGPGSDDQA